MFWKVCCFGHVRAVKTDHNPVRGKEYKDRLVVLLFRPGFNINAARPCFVLLPLFVVLCTNDLLCIVLDVNLMLVAVYVWCYFYYSDVFSEVAVGTRQDKLKPLVPDPQGVLPTLC